MIKKVVSLFIVILLVNNIAFANELSLSGASYILMEEKSGRIIVERNSHAKMPMASTTKIMTALLALEQGNLDDIVEIGEESVGVEGSSLYLKLGERVTLRDLVYGLMLRSGNDSAVAIANYIGDSEENFVDYMNKRSRLIGANNTNFVNPHGLHDVNHYSTAYDLALITREAFGIDGFAEVSGSKIYKGMRQEYNYYVNKNKTLWEYDGGDGVKIGYTTSAGRCLVSSATKNNMRLIAVTLNARDWFNDNYKLFDYGFGNYKLYSIYEKDQFISNLNIINGTREKVPLVAENDFLYPLSDEEMGKVRIGITLKEDIEAPINKGQVLGYIEVFLDGSLIKKDKLVSKYDVAEKQLLEKILDRLKIISN